MSDPTPLTPGTPTGWYPDPTGARKARYWDGVRWTQSARDDVPVSPIPSPEEVVARRVPLAVEADERWRAVTVATSHEIAGHRILEHRGEVFGITVRTRNMFSDFGAGVRNLVGGEVGGYTKMLTVARREALDRLRQETVLAGGNAVISMRMTANSLSDAVTEVVAYGTAVKVEQDAA
ncbi:MAG: hypothetical protein JWQ18_1188 [Conexibacter sp.]|nr:hypothetical protein [Conexibacter sp.]